MNFVLKNAVQFKLVACILFALLLRHVSSSSTKSDQRDSQEGSWNVTDKNTTCIRANLKIEFTVYREAEKFTFFLSPSAKSSLSNCDVSNMTQILVLTDDSYTFAVEFEKDSLQTYARNISLSYEYTTGETGAFYNDTKLWPVHNGNSYLCRSNETIYMGNATMKILNIHLEAFGKEGDHDFSTPEECVADDDSVSDVFVISVACGLALLIIVVLIAYLVGRRRSRLQRGYQSV